MTTPNFNEANQLEIVPPTAIESISRAEVDMQITTAKRYPRQLSRVKGDMISFATLDEDTAASCFYTLPRGGKSIQGPSVRLAEIAVACYGNLRAGTRIVEVCAKGEAPHVLVQAVCHDLEKNTAITVEKRRRIVKKRNKDSVDEDDINLAANAGSAIAFRDAVYKVVPGALIRPVYEQAKKVAIGDAKSLVERRSRAFDSLGKMGITPDRILAVVERASIEEVTVSDLETLFGLHTALRDGQTTIEEAFPPAKKAEPETPKKPNFSANTATENQQGRGGETTAGPVPEDGHGVVAEAPEPSGEPLRDSTAEGSGELPLEQPPAEKKGPPPFAANTAKEKISVALRDMSINQGVFMQGLRKLDPDTFSRNWTVVAQLPDELAEKIWEEGLDDLLAILRSKGVKL